MKKIPLTQGKVALVDDEDYGWLSKWKWYAIKGRNTYYAAREHYVSPEVRYIVRMHREIMGAGHRDGNQFDHADRNGLNNQKNNLRRCTHQQNQFNQKPWTKCTSHYKGVYQRAGKKNWTAQISRNGKVVHLGNRGSEIECAKLYDKNAKELHGKFAVLNFQE